MLFRPKSDLLKRLLLSVLCAFTILACKQTTDNNHPNPTAVNTPTAEQISSALEMVNYTNIVQVCSDYLSPLGKDPQFNASSSWSGQSTIITEIYPAFMVPGMENTTIRFGPKQVNSYHLDGTKVYSLVGDKLAIATKRTLEYNKNVIGYIAYFTVHFGELRPTITRGFCSQIIK